jgi:hypothetical protein
MKDLRIQGETVLDMPTKNGVLNEENVSFVQRTVLFDALRSNKDLVKYKQGYPLDEMSNVSFKVEFMILSMDRYKELLTASGQCKCETSKA